MSNTYTYTVTDYYVNDSLEDLRELFVIFEKLKNERTYNKFIKNADETVEVIKSNIKILKPGLVRSWFMAQLQEVRKLECAVGILWEEVKASRLAPDRTAAAQPAPMMTTQPMVVKVNNEPATGLETVPEFEKMENLPSLTARS